MSATPFFIAALLLPVAGLLSWVGFLLAQVKDEMRCFSGFEGMHFDFGPQPAATSD